METNKSYEAPRIVDYGNVKEITEINQNAALVDLPLGTPTLPGQVPLGSQF